jgi:hypothetical protein
MAEPANVIAVLSGGLPVVRRSLASLCRGRIRVTHGAFPEDLEIEDGYPSDARVDEIGCVSIRDAVRWLRDVLPHAINALPCGRATVEPFDDRGRSMLRITVITGGWSGVESIVYAVLDHTVMRQFVTEQHCGGLYVLEVPTE